MADTSVGLVAAYDLATDDSPNVLDKTANGNNGTLFGTAAYVASDEGSKPGFYLNFPGVAGSRATMPNSASLASLTTTGMIMAWVQAPATTPALAWYSKASGAPPTLMDWESRTGTALRTRPAVSDGTNWERIIGVGDNFTINVTGWVGTAWDATNIYGLNTGAGSTAWFSQAFSTVNRTADGGFDLHMGEAYPGNASLNGRIYVMYVWDVFDPAYAVDMLNDPLKPINDMPSGANVPHWIRGRSVTP